MLDNKIDKCSGLFRKKISHYTKGVKVYIKAFQESFKEIYERDPSEEEVNAFLIGYYSHLKRGTL